ncbi:hypothetical protein BX661DRAFT_173739 [Kickxella alabastrina]|uniref:uncharacterized protein n=1 Tax=Kickxella alabastrina TaxID=61397 RepID=UPI002220CDCA|nr:uncharacterized protein BX661DRAFT_173739 [Kickxella alabastrina]KAI7820102.1 hypothetical protein BX661DRAFT_173739 [Kickxella alabastrina]
MGDSSSIGDDDGESPTVSQMSRSLLFRLDLLSPTARKNSCSSSEEDMTDDEIPPSLAADKIAPSLPPPLSSLLDPNALDMHAGEDIGQDIGQVGDKIAETEKRAQPFQLRRPNNPGKGILIDAKPEQKQHERVVKAVLVPQIFVSPLLPRSDRGTEKTIAKELKLVRHHFDRNFGGFETAFSAVTVDCGMPRFVNRALFRYATRSSNDSAASPLSGSEVIGKRVHRSDSGSWPSYEHFCDVWTRLRRSSADDSALLFNILTDDATKPRAYVTRDEIKLLVTDVVDNHFELEFLEGQDMFAQSYAETVTERIFYEGNRTWDGKMTLAQFRRANIVGLMRTIEEGIDIDNRDPGVFSYKHFYVLFCSFFELDADRDRLLDARDLLRYFTNTLSRRIISRIMMGKGKKSEHPAKNGSEVAAARAKAKAHKRKDGKIMYSRYDLNVRLSACRMTYRDFIWFLLSEIDKSTPPAIEYWFRCLDLDGDGVLSVYELEYFYDEQVSRMEEEMSGDMIMLDDLMCQLSDMVRPEKEGMFTLKDLRRAPPKLMPIFFDAFMNLQRFLEHEARTSFLQRQLAQLSQRALPTVPFKEVIQARMEFLACLPSPWVEFADQEYAALMNDQGEQSGENIDDFADGSTSVGVNVSDSGN